MYPGTGQKWDFLFMKVGWIVNKGTEVHPSYDKNPSCFKVNKLFTFVVALNVL